MTEKRVPWTYLDFAEAERMVDRMLVELGPDDTIPSIDAIMRAEEVTGFEMSEPDRGRMSMFEDRVYEGADTIDPRDVLTRIEELKGLRDGEEDDPFTEDDSEELTKLTKFSEWIGDADGTLISDSYFKTYAEELAEDIGAIDPKARWPLSHIDWEAAADELKHDYRSAEYGSTKYWYRS